LTTLHNFSGPDGSTPYAGLTQTLLAPVGFVGTTSTGGAHGDGTIFEVFSNGTFKKLFDLCAQKACADGSTPFGGFSLDTIGFSWGTTTYGGSANHGLLLAMGNDLSTYSSEHDFCVGGGCTDGMFPQSAPVQQTKGPFYGTTTLGGTGGAGTVYKMDVGDKPFIRFVRGSGEVGQTIEILGEGFDAGTTVTFGTLPAKRTIVLDTYLTATVPSGATTSTVTVVDPLGTLKSNVAFLVVPQVSSFTPSSGAVGISVTITGVSLKQTLAVSFNGIPATTFTVKSDTEVIATVPTGATTGKIEITTKGGNTFSAGSFTVTP
jgi:hypothetical protein